MCRPSSQVAAGEVMIEIDEGDESQAGVRRRPAARRPARDRAGCTAPGGGAVAGLRCHGRTNWARHWRNCEAEPSPPRGRLLKMLRAAVVQEQLFKSGPFDDAVNEAGESSMDQLAWFAHHRRFDDKKLSERYRRRLGRFLALHGIDELVEGDPIVAHALLRLFQARRSQEDASALALAVLRALARSQAAEARSFAIGTGAARGVREARQRSRAARRPPGRHGGLEPDLLLAGSA